MKEKILEIIQNARKKKGFAQQVVADKLGVTLRQYQRIEAGEFPKYKTDTIKKLDDVLGIKIYDMIYVENADRNITNGSNSLNDFEESYGKDQLIEALRETIAAQKKTIEQLETRLKEKSTSSSHVEGKMVPDIKKR